METTSLSSVFQAAGPFATVLADVSRDSENGAHVHDLHVREACDALTEQGADEQVVAAVRERLAEPPQRSAPVARVVVANADGVLYDEVAGFRVDQPVATWAPLPDLAAWITHRDSAVDFVLAVVDHEGGDVAVYDSDVPEAEEESSITNDHEHINKVPVGGWSALRYQHVTENVWNQNAQAVVEQITSHLRQGHRLVLLGGDPHSKGTVKAALEDTEATVVDLETGSRAQDGGDEALQQAIREALMDHVVRRRLERTHELKQRVGRGEGAATGIDEVADAFVRGQVQTLVIDPRAAGDAELDPSRHPGLALGPDVATDRSLRADQALVAAAALTDAEVAVGSTASLGGAPAAALLRWDQAATGSEG